jgi:hypothetical protein
LCLLSSWVAEVEAEAPVLLGTLGAVVVEEP